VYLILHRHFCPVNFLVRLTRRKLCVFLWSSRYCSPFVIQFDILRQISLKWRAGLSHRTNTRPATLVSFAYRRMDGRTGGTILIGAPHGCRRSQKICLKSLPLNRLLKPPSAAVSPILHPQIPPSRGWPTQQQHKMTCLDNF